MSERSRRVGAAVGAGLLLTVGLPPFGWWLLALVGAAVLARTVAGCDGWRDRAVVGFAAAVAFLAPGLWWMSEFTLPGWALATLLECALFTLGVTFAVKATWLPLTLLVADAVRSSWPFEGVPVATLAQTQVGGPLDDLARVGGELLIGLVVVAVGVGLTRRRLLLAPVVWLVVFANVYAPDGSSLDREIDVAIVQGGGERGTRAIDTDEDVVFDRHVDASELIRASPDLVLWPENVVHVDDDVEATAEGRSLSSLASDRDTTLVAGVVESGDDEFLNFAYVWAPDGDVDGVYEKNTRVPFGEWIPFRSVVERLGDVSAVPRDMRVGDGPGFVRSDVADLGIVISWEVFFADRARDAIVSGGDVLLVPTNAASFSTTQMPALEVGAARLRAIETGRWVVQAAPTGFSAVVTPNGGIVIRTSLGERAVLHSSVELRTGSTLYTRLGDGPFVVGALVLLALSGRRVARRRSRRTA